MPDQLLQTLIDRDVKPMASHTRTVPTTGVIRPLDDGLQGPMDTPKHRPFRTLDPSARKIDAQDIIAGFLGGIQPEGTPYQPTMPAVGGITKNFKPAAQEYLQSLRHGVPELERIASGSGPIRLYHGTTIDNAERILKEGVKLPQSADEYAKQAADLYGIPWAAWKQEYPWTSYGSEIKRLSTAPYGVAQRWAKHFPQGEVMSEMNAKARILSEARKRGIPHDDFYNQVYEDAAKQGIHGQFKALDAVGLPDLMKPQRRGGVVLGIDTDVRAMHPKWHSEAQLYLEDARKGSFSIDDALKYWDGNFKDFKIAPQNIKDIVPVRKFGR